jgi:hypothetical protein
MKRLTPFAVAIVFIMIMVSGAAAVPRLQTYIVGSDYYNFYRQEFRSWITNSNSFDLKVVGYWRPASLACSSMPSGAYCGGYDFMDCYLMLSMPQGESGRIWINGNEITGFGSYRSNLPDGIHPNPFTRYHLPAAFGSFNFQGIGRIDNDQINARDYSPGGTSTPGWGDEILLNVVVSGYSWAHFDAIGVDSYGRTFTNSFSNDASYYRKYATPEPGTLSLLGLGLLGIIPILRRKRD